MYVCMYIYICIWPSNSDLHARDPPKSPKCKQAGNPDFLLGFVPKLVSLGDLEIRNVKNCMGTFESHELSAGWSSGIIAANWVPPTAFDWSTASV